MNLDQCGSGCSGRLKALRLTLPVAPRK